MNKEEAIAKYHSIIGVELTQDEVSRDWPKERIAEFWKDVKHLCWPENWGSSPWPTLLIDLGYNNNIRS